MNSFFNDFHDKKNKIDNSSNNYFKSNLTYTTKQKKNNSNLHNNFANFKVLI